MYLSIIYVSYSSVRSSCSQLDFNIQPDQLEKVTPKCFDPRWRPEFIIQVASSREDAITMDDKTPLQFKSTRMAPAWTARLAQVWYSPAMVSRKVHYR
jgi:hypothetical protein